MLRRYTNATIGVKGYERVSEHMAPATAEFENAFNAFARGTLISTPDGPRAIEDLRPGQLVETLENGPQAITWIGSMTLVPSAPVVDPAQSRLTRITGDRFGQGKPASDLMVGPGARMLHSPDMLRDDELRGQSYTSFTDFVDGDSVFEVVPPAALETFHLCLAQHATIFANEVAVESYHPGYHLAETMGPNKLALFVSLFPHLDELADFGLLAHPRMSLRTLMMKQSAA
ncbi:Hint domain-containing protein [Pseudooceanicola sp.]|uniref:Hint domain-containing protein n=1 Tax=Pseudooceanicola sp. TaxID=1914328 RepID=UPI002612AA0E|nr:Hint domain-containing protein [Pseudooceanicola sp.]